jgi:hypothetical protein
MKDFLFGKAPLAILLLCFSLQPLSAQLVKSVVVDSIRTPFASVVALNGKDPKNIVVGAASNTMFYSIDEGQTWQTAVITPKASSTSNASLVSDYKGNFYYIYMADSASTSKIVVQVSDDGGKSWEANDGPDLSMQKYSQLCVHIDVKNNLYLTWTQFSKDIDGNCQSNIMLSKSTNKGKKWSDSILLSQAPGNCDGNEKTLSSAAAATIGFEKVFAAWLNNGQIIMDRTYDGKTWLNNDINITSVEQKQIDVPGFNNCNGVPMFVGDNGKSFFGGSLYLITTRKQKNDDVDVLFLRSHNAGDNWTTPMGFADDEPGTIQFKPAIAVDQETGYIYIVYYSQPHIDSNETQVFIAYSKDGGASFLKRMINAKSFFPAKNNVSGSYISLTASKGVIVPTWIEMSNGKPYLRSAYFKQENFWKK